MKKQVIASMLVLLAAVGIASAQTEDSHYINNLLNQNSGIQPVSYEFGCDSGCGETGCADLGCSQLTAGRQQTECEVFVPNIIGDSFGVPRVFNTIDPTILLNFPTHIAKVSDNNNVRPYDRLSFSYNYFQNVPETFNAGATILTETDISEYRIYGEKTILNGVASLNIVVPIYDTVSFQQTSGTIVSGTEFGNLAFGGKVLLVEREKFSVSAGLQVEAPTSRDFGYPASGDVVLNESWYLTPYLASLYTPNDIFFMQSFLSHRTRTGSDRVTNLGTPTGESIFQQNLLMADIAAGFWATRSSGRGVTGIAPVVEMHYSTTTEDDNPITFTSIYYNRRDMLNMTFGTHIEFNERHILSLGYALPLRDKPLPGGLPTDRAFDGEFSVQMSLYR